jgi:hypothetical protein
VPADPDSLRVVESLTDRRRDILRLLAGGLSNAAIACELGLTEGPAIASGRTVQLEPCVWPFGPNCACRVEGVNGGLAEAT